MEEADADCVYDYWRLNRFFFSRFSCCAKAWVIWLVRTIDTIVALYTVDWKKKLAGLARKINESLGSYALEIFLWTNSWKHEELQGSDRSRRWDNWQVAHSEGSDISINGVYSYLLSLLLIRMLLLTEGFKSTFVLPVAEMRPSWIPETLTIRLKSSLGPRNKTMLSQRIDTQSRV